MFVAKYFTDNRYYVKNDQLHLRLLYFLKMTFLSQQYFEKNEQ